MTNRQVKTGAAMLAAILAVTGCKAPGAGGDVEERVPDKEAAFGAGNFKADCIGCSEADAKSALEQTGLASRFLKTSDFWTVAYRFNVPTQIERKDLDTLETGTALEGGDIYLFDYEVESKERRVVGDYKREVATIRIFQATVSNSFEGLVQAAPIDEHEKELKLEMDDLLRAVGKIYYNEDYPNGRYVGIEPGEGVRPTSDAFPTAVPNINKARSATKALPDLPADLLAVAAKAQELGKIPADWKTRGYRHFTFSSGEETYWAEGELWPFLVRSDAGTALLVDTTGVRE